MNTVLSQLKIVELASVLAGPAVGMYFAEKGAQVIKIENSRTKGDVTRSWKLPMEDVTADSSAYFCSVNWGKEHLFLDLNRDSDFEQVIKYIIEADVVITNFKAGDAKKFKLDFDAIRSLNQDVILAEISGYGQKSDKLAYDLILQAETGFMSMNGTQDSGPVKMPVALIDILAAHQLKEGILEALLERQIQKGAYHVHVSLYDTAVASLANQASNYLTTGHVAQRIGSKHPNIAPYGELFTTRDNRLITFAVGSDKHFQLLCDFLKIELPYNSNQERVQNRVIIEKALAEKVKEFNAADLTESLNKRHVPVAIIQNIDEVFNHELSQDLILSDQNGKRVKTAVYSLRKG